MTSVLFGFIGGILAVLFTAHFANRKERNILIEKWMNNLRDEISIFIGKCEQLRCMKNQYGENIDANKQIYGEIVRSLHKISLLLSREDEEQSFLMDKVEKLLRIVESSKFNDYFIVESEVVSAASVILNKSWKQINSELQSVTNCIPEFKFIKKLLNKLNIYI